jgi:hypothetical protein
VRIVLAVVGVLGCGPGMKRPEPTVSFADASGDAAKIEGLLQVSVTNGGLWFDDGTCAAKFQRPGDVKPDAFPMFARCLAGLHLQRSAREDALGDVAVMSYAPGFEVEARVVNERSGPRLTWIGFVARRSAQEQPTITVDVLEALRVSGDRNGPLDPALTAKLVLDPTSKTKAEYTWLKVCIDETGAVTSASPYETTSLAATAAFKDAVSKWTFRPFTIQGQPVPVCAMVRPAYPPAAAPAVETLPLPPPPSRSRHKDPIVFAEGAVHKLMEGKRIRGEKMISPDDDTKYEIQKSRVHRISGTFRVCVDDHGTVESVLPVRSTGFASYDRSIIGGIHQWVYSPFLVDDQAVPVCTSVMFIYSQR